MSFETYDRVFVINLDRRADRMMEIKKELDRVEVRDFERVSAVDGRSINKRYPIAIGNVGCVMSHLNVVKLAKERGYKSYVVFEDDAEFHPDFVKMFQERIGAVPADWDCIFLGGSHMTPPQRINEHVVRMLRTYTTHAMIIRDTLYDQLIEVWGDQSFRSEVDVAMASIHSRNKCYSFSPPLAWQKAGFSDILEKYDDYKHLRK